MGAEIDVTGGMPAKGCTCNDDCVCGIESQRLNKRMNMLGVLFGIGLVVLLGFSVMLLLTGRTVTKLKQELAMERTARAALVHRLEEADSRLAAHANSDTLKFNALDDKTARALEAAEDAQGSVGDLDAELHSRLGIPQAK